MATVEQKTTVKAAVETGAAIFAKWEESLKANRNAVGNLEDVFEEVRDAGLISPFECRAISLEMASIALSNQAAVWAFHNRLVRRCVELGIDVPAPSDPSLPQPMDGGGHR